MDRLQTKCLLASAAFHGLLAALLASASLVHLRPRLNQGSRDPNAAVIQLVTLSSEQRADAPAAANVPPQNQQSRLLAPEPKNPDAPRRENQVARSSTDSAVLSRRDMSRPAANNGRLLEMSRMLEDMARRVPTGKAIALEIGSGEIGKDDAYARIVRFFYAQSWEPAGDNDPKIATKAKVTIANDGKVSSALIVQSSGDARLDESVKRTLERVQFIEPFEPGAKESERSYTINFRVGMTGVSAD